MCNSVVRQLSFKGLSCLVFACAVVTSQPASGQDLIIAKTHTGNFTQGQTGATYSITVTNQGAAATNGVVTVTDTLPAGLTATSISGTGWTCIQPSGPCTRSDALGGAGTAIPLTFTTTLNATGTIGSTAFGNSTVTFKQVTTTASIGQCGIAFPCAPPSTTNTITIAGVGTFVIPVNTFFFDDQTGPLNGVIGFNRSGGADIADLQNIQFANYDFKSAIGPIPGTLVSANSATIPTTGGTVNLTYTNTIGLFTATLGSPTVTMASYSPLTLTVNVAANAPAMVTNTATVAGGGEVNASNDVASDVTMINVVNTPGVPDLTITKTHVGNFTQGQTGATYTITVNNANTTATNGVVTVTDTVPTGLTATSISGAGWVCTQPSGPCTRSDALGGPGSTVPITFTLSAVGSGTANGIAFTNALVTFAQATTTANIMSCGTGIPCALNTTTNTVTVAGLGTFVIPVNTFFFNNQTGTPPGVVGFDRTGFGDFIDLQNAAFTTYDLKSAIGPLTGTQLSVNPVAIPTNGGNVVVTLANTGTFTATVGAASYPPLTLTVSVDPTAPAMVTNVATVSGGGETNTTNDTASDVTVINASGGGGGGGNGSDLQLLKSHTGDFTPGQVGAVYTLQVLNFGTAASSGPVTVVDLLPAGLTATSLTGADWNCTLATLTCVSLAPVDISGRRSSPITLVVNVAANAPSLVVNTATVSGGGDSNPNNNTASDPTNILAPGGRTR